MGGVIHSAVALSQCHCLSGGVSFACLWSVMMPVFQPSIFLPLGFNTKLIFFNVNKGGLYVKNYSMKSF